MTMTARELAGRIEQRNPAQIAATIARLIHDGHLAPGERLPIISDVAAQLGVSAGTVSSAWRTLAAVGLVAARGRAGTFVLPEPASWLPPRYRTMPEPSAQVRLDLSTGIPDAALLPPLRASLERTGASAGAEVNSYLTPPVLPELEEILHSTWPFKAQRMTVVNGAMDGLIRTLNQVTRFGDRVAVENPGYPPVFDILDQLGLSRVPLALDAAGVTPLSLAAALGKDVRAVILQPRAQNPTGASLTATRARALAGVLRAHRTGPGAPIVVEDDHSGDIVLARDTSLGTHLPDQVVHIRSYSKSHGPDLRMAAVGGPAHVLDSLVARRLMGAGWTSRLLQRVLVDMLTDRAAIAAVERARGAYAARRAALVDALAGHGIALAGGHGLNLWLPVHDEAVALARLGAVGIRVAPGAPFHASENEAAPHVRVTVGLLAGDFEHVAQVMALAAAP